jgi:hypothetical protein
MDGRTVAGNCVSVARLPYGGKVSTFFRPCQEQKISARNAPDYSLTGVEIAASVRRMTVSFVSGSAAITAIASLIGLSPEAQAQVDAAIAAIRAEMRENPVGHPADTSYAPPRTPSAGAPPVGGELTEKEAMVLEAIREGYKSATKVGGRLGMLPMAVNRICGQLGAKGKLVPSGHFFRLAEFAPDPEYVAKGNDIGAMQHARAVVAFLAQNGSSTRDAVLYGCDSMLEDGEAKYPLWQVTHILHAIADRGLITCDPRSLQWSAAKP